MKTNTNFWRLFRRSTAAGLVLLLVLVSAPVAEAGFWVKRDWSRVQRVAPGTKTTVLLYKDQASPGKKEDQGTLPLGHGRIRHAHAGPRANTHPAEAGGAQGSGSSPSQETLPGMDYRRGWRRNRDTWGGTPGKRPECQGETPCPLGIYCCAHSHSFFGSAQNGGHLLCAA